MRTPPRRLQRYEPLAQEWDEEGESASWRNNWSSCEADFARLLHQRDEHRAYELYSNVLEEWLGAAEKDHKRLQIAAPV